VKGRERDFLTDEEEKEENGDIYISKKKKEIKFFKIIIVLDIHLAPNDDVIFNHFKLMHADIKITNPIKNQNETTETHFFFSNDNLISN